MKKRSWKLQSLRLIGIRFAVKREVVLEGMRLPFWAWCLACLAKFAFRCFASSSEFAMLRLKKHAICILLKVSATLHIGTSKMFSLLPCLATLGNRLESFDKAAEVVRSVPIEQVAPGHHAAQPDNQASALH